MLAGKKILIAVSGSIAAYKAAFFVRLLVRQKAEVKVIMTESAKDFITPLTLATLSKNPVYSSFYKNDQGEWVNHVELGLWADLMVVAPATANTLSKMANGICDSLVLAVYLSARCPVYFAPAMDLDMYRHDSTQKNIALLKSRGNKLIDVGEGELASGLNGQGRMAEPEELVKILSEHFESGKFTGKKVLITSGPTYESIDAVRFIGNHSSGKMGKAIALELANQGAEVSFITGPVSSVPTHEAIAVTRVKSADEMYKAVKSKHKTSDISIFAAAVSDYRPKETSRQKRKRNGKSFQIELIENPDIAFEMGKLKLSKQIHVGFALETHNEEQFAREKLKKKNFDLIVMNSLNDTGAGFSHDTNQITIYDQDNNKFPFELKSKADVARDILTILSNHA